MLREPLVHFVLLGTLLFVMHAWLRPSASVADSQIRVSEPQIRMLARNFERTWRRPATRAELDGLIAEHVREEVLYREALSLGLDRNDVVIRRRLRQKMEFVSDEAASLAQPSDQELSAYLAAHPELFAREGRASFRQVFLDPQQRRDTLEGDVQVLLARLNQAGASATDDLGDSLRLVEPYHENASQTQVAGMFGADFAQALFQQSPGRWVGPIVSGYGVHLVHIDSITPGGLPALEDVRALVQREWERARRDELAESFYQALRGKYSVTVDLPSEAADNQSELGAEREGTRQ